MSTTISFILAVLLLVTSAPTRGAPPHRDHADEYASQLLDEDNPQRHMAGSRLKAINERQSVPAEVERRLAAYLRQPPTEAKARAEMINQVASVLATSHAESPAIGEIVDALARVLDQQPLAVARRGAVDALYMISRHTTLTTATMAMLEDRAFSDADREVRIGAIRAVIQSGPDEELKRRLDGALMEQAGLDDKGFAAPETWNYDTRRDHNAVLVLLWSLHEPEVPEAVMGMWVSKLVGGNLHDTAYRMLENVVKLGPLPEPIYDGLLAAAERESPAVDPGRREKLYRLLQRSRLTNEAAPEAVDDLGLAKTFALDPDIGRRRTAAHRLREFANANRPTHESLELLAGIAEREEDRELRDLALRILGYAAPKEYVEVLHGYFNSGHYDHLVLRIFLAAYGRADWVRRYASDADLRPRVRAAAIYDYSRSGFEVPEDMISFLQEIARHDAEYAVRQGAGQALAYLDAWVPLMTRLEREENQLQALFSVWQSAVGVYLLSGLVGIFFFSVRWSRVRQRFSWAGMFAWIAAAAMLVPAIGFGALSLFRHNGPTPTSGEMFLTFLPTYILVAYFGYTTLQIIRAGLNASDAPAAAEVR